MIRFLKNMFCEIPLGVAKQLVAHGLFENFIAFFSTVNFGRFKVLGVRDFISKYRKFELYDPIKRLSSSISFKCIKGGILYALKAFILICLCYKVSE